MSTHTISVHTSPAYDVQIGAGLLPRCGQIPQPQKVGPQGEQPHHKPLPAQAQGKFPVKEPLVGGAGRESVTRLSHSSCTGTRGIWPKSSRVAVKMVKISPMLQESR